MHFLPTLVDIFVSVGEMGKLGLLVCFGVQAATRGRAVPVGYKPAFCRSSTVKGTGWG